MFLTSKVPKKQHLLSSRTCFFLHRFILRCIYCQSLSRQVIIHNMIKFILSLLFVAAIAVPDKLEGKPPPKPEGKAGKKKLESEKMQEKTKKDLVRADDQINIQPMRQCEECWECYACTHDEHYGLTGNCVPILGCEPSMCSYDGDCGEGRSCVAGNCNNQECSHTSECANGKHCYYGECRDTCSHSSDCTEKSSGDICEHGLCGMY